MKNQPDGYSEDEFVPESPFKKSPFFKPGSLTNKKLEISNKTETIFDEVEAQNRLHQSPPEM